MQNTPSVSKPTFEVVTDVAILGQTAPGTAGANKPAEPVENYRLLIERSPTGAMYVLAHSTDHGKTGAVIRAPVDATVLSAWVGDGKNAEGKAIGLSAIQARLMREARFPLTSRRLIGEVAYLYQAAFSGLPHTVNCEALFQDPAVAAAAKQAGISYAQAAAVAASQRAARTVRRF